MNCFFCCYHSNPSKPDPIYQDDLCYVIEDEYPVSLGHLLIIPKVHTENLFTASERLQQHLLSVVNKTKHSLQDLYNPDGFNVGVNCGEAAGQTIFHLHIHLIPRYKGDVESPRGGVRGVIPQKQRY